MNSFDYDSFLSLLLRYMDRKVSHSERLYIERTLQESEDARLLMKDVEETFAWDVSTLLPAKNPLRKSGTVKKIIGADIGSAMRGTAMALSIGCFLALISFTLWDPHKKMEKELQYTEEAHESVHGPRISLGAESEIISDSGYTRIITSPSPEGNKWNNVHVPRGCTFKLKLPDGTKVRLSPDSKLRFPPNLSGGNREVYLEGEAYFEVTPDTQTLFIVHTCYGDLTSYDTKFNVEAYLYDGRCEVSVMSGKVLVQKEAQKILLNAGKALSISGDRPSPHIASFDEAVITERLEGKYFFVDRDLINICQLAQRVYNVNIIIDNEKIGGQKFTGILSTNRSVASFFEMLSATCNINYYRESNGNWHVR